MTTTTTTTTDTGDYDLNHLHSSNDDNDKNTTNNNNNNNCKKIALDNVEQQQQQDDDYKISSTKEYYFNGVEISKLTKRQMKKYTKYLKWQKMKKEKRKEERLKTKQKRINAILNNNIDDLKPSRKQLKRMMKTMNESSCKIGVCIDLNFDDLMIDKDMAKAIKQILRVYTENRRANAPMQLHLTSFSGRCKEEMSKHHGYENWDINFHTDDYLKVFPKEKLIYLSSESDNTIKELEQDKIYIIGGLVDHNSHKGICLKKAKEQGIIHGQLPISEYFWTRHRKVFTINQVFEILLRVSEGKTFKEAFEMILPKRINMIPTNLNDNDSLNKDENNQYLDN